jgi:hypothetical protein
MSTIYVPVFVYTSRRPWLGSGADQPCFDDEEEVVVVVVVAHLCLSAPDIDG